MNHSEEIEKILANKSLFESTVYTPIEEALEEIKKRWNDISIDEALKPFLSKGVPELLKDGARAVIFRQLTTPNYEIRRFMSIPDATGIKPLLWEYHDDKFTSNNPLKYYLGKIGIHAGIGKKGGHRVSYENVIDFNKSNGKIIRDVQTTWGQSLIDFHHEMLEKAFPGVTPHIFDASTWFHDHGGTAKDYYKNYVALFIKHGVLFENFVLEGDELTFTKEVFLPAFFDIWEKTGKKPLIVALEPTEIENEEFWMCHPAEHSAEFIRFKKLDSK